MQDNNSITKLYLNLVWVTAPEPNDELPGLRLLLSALSRTASCWADLMLFRFYWAQGCIVLPQIIARLKVAHQTSEGGF